MPPIKKALGRPTILLIPALLISLFLNEPLRGQSRPDSPTALSPALAAPSGISDQEELHLKRWAQRLFDSMPQMPLLFFPETESKILKKLALSIRRNYYTRTLVQQVRGVRKSSESGAWDFESLRIDFSNFLFRGIRPVACFIDIQEPRVKPALLLSRPDRAVKWAKAVHTLILDPESVSAFVSKEAVKYGLSMPSFSVLDKGRARVAGKLKILWCDMNVEAVIRIEACQGDIVFYIDRMAVSGIGVPRFIVGRVLRTFNPVLRAALDIMPLGLRPESVLLDRGQVTIISISEPEAGEKSQK